MKVLILGGDGMLAYALKQVFSFHKVVSFGHKTCDITDPYQTESHIKALRPDLVLNCAAYTDVDGAESEKNLSELVNAIAVEALAQVCKKVDARLLHFSTEMVFGQEDPVAYTEDIEPRDPLNVYGKTKLMGERYIQQTWLKHYIVRTSWLFGPKGWNFIDKVIDRANKEHKIEVVNDQWGCPTYTFDLARAVYNLVIENSPFGIYHLTNDGSISRDRFAWEIFDYSSLMCEITALPSSKLITAAARPKNGVLLNTKRPQLPRWSDAMVEYLIGCGVMSAI